MSGVTRSLGIGFVGADGTGKTTLLNALREKFGSNVAILSEVARPIIARGYPLGKNASTESYIELQRSYQEQLYKCLTSSQGFISDRTLLDPYCYARINSELPRPQIREEFIQFMEAQWRMDSLNYSTYFYFPIEFPVSGDGIRVEDEKYRSNIDNLLKRLIAETSVNIETIAGTHAERTSKALSIIEGLKFG